MISSRTAVRSGSCILALALATLVWSRVPAEGEVRPPAGRFDAAVAPAPTTEGLNLTSIRRSDLVEATLHQDRVTLSNVRLDEIPSATLELVPMRVLSDRARVVVARPGGDEPFGYDVSAVHAFRGKVRGVEDSSVVVVSSPRRLSGYVELPGVGKKYKLLSVDRAGRPLSGDAVAVYPVVPGSEPDAGVGAPKCGGEASSVVAGCCPEPSAAAVFNQRMRVVEIALETDYDLFETFGDLSATADHVVEIMARSNVAFHRDINVRFDVVFMRFFDNPGLEPAFMNNPDPLTGYVDFWNEFMFGVARDTGAFFSGRRDLPYGGVAYIGAVCTDFAYCISGYLRGFGDGSLPEYGEYDVGVVIHELGHNFNACHTPDYCPFIDLCYPPPTVPQRGTVMSYCSQTVSGGDLAEDQWYHTRIRRVMRDFAENDAFCAHYDCNENGMDDTIDLLNATSPDVNGNGIPDECEDCNNNSVLDPTDIANATSTDLNGNGMPDECEPDCNGNNVPDDRDIRLGTSVDTWGNGVPDECDADCDGNLVADYNQIQSNLTLDIDRNVVLDACQDCDNDGISDLIEVNDARFAWVASDVLNYIGEYHPVAGTRARTSPAGTITSAQDLIIAGGSKVLVSSGSGNKVVAFDAHSGALQGDFVTAGLGGLSFPTGMTIGPNGNLFVSSRNNSSVIQYQGTTGALIGTFVATGSGGLAAPYGLIFGPNGNLFVSSGNQVMEYNGATGAFVRVFVTAADNGGLASARGLLFKPTDGNLLAASYASDAIIQYNGTTGASMGKWNSGGTASALYLDGPWGIRMGPTGNVYCTRDLPASEFGHDHDGHDDNEEHDTNTAELHVTAVRILEFDIKNGKYAGAFIVGDDTQLRSPTGFDFMPVTGDCDFNLVPDSCDTAACSDFGCQDCNGNTFMDRCDIRSGVSVDSNGNQKPDECETPTDPVPDGLGDKTRTVAFTAPPLPTASGASGQTAIRVTMVDLQNPVPSNPPCCPSPNFGSFESSTCTASGEANGCVRWMGPPAVHLDRQDNPALGVFKAARLQCTPYYHDWASEGLVHAVGAEIVPSSAYDLEALSSICKGTESSCTVLSNAVRFNTRRAGDLATPYNPPSGSVQPDSLDVTSIVDKFKGNPNSPPKPAMKLQPNVPDPNVDIDALDIVAVIDHFRGFAYAYFGPCPCPSTVACNAVACASDAACSGGSCIKTCASGPKIGQQCQNNQHCGSCAGGGSAGYPCDVNGDCPGGVCTLGTCGTGFCRDRCGRCN